VPGADQDAIYLTVQHHMACRCSPALYSLRACIWIPYIASVLSGAIYPMGHSIKSDHCPVTQHCWKTNSDTRITVIAEYPNQILRVVW